MYAHRASAKWNVWSACLLLIWYITISLYYAAVAIATVASTEFTLCRRHTIHKLNGSLHLRTEICIWIISWRLLNLSLNIYTSIQSITWNAPYYLWTMKFILYEWKDYWSFGRIGVIRWKWPVMALDSMNSSVSAFSVNWRNDQVIDQHPFSSVRYS